MFRMKLRALRILKSSSAAQRLSRNQASSRNLLRRFASDSAVQSRMAQLASEGKFADVISTSYSLDGSTFGDVSSLVPLLYAFAATGNTASVNKLMETQQRLNAASN